MDNTFENGFMCGLLLSISSNKDHSKIKDPIFREILENGIPVATVKLSKHYKIVYNLYHNTKYPQFYNSYAYIVNATTHDVSTVEEVVTRDDSGNLIYPKAHSEFYGQSYGNVMLFAIFYKDETPLVADYIGAKGVGPSFSSTLIYHYPAGSGHYSDNDYAKELVYWKYTDRIFLKDSVEYLGDYTLKPIVDDVNKQGSKIIIEGLLDKDGNLISNNLKASFTVNLIKYKATYPDYTAEDGSIRRDYSKRPIITKSSESEYTESIGIAYDKQHTSSSNTPRYSDLTLQEILDMNIDIAKDIRETLGDTGCYTAKKAVLLN